MKKNSHTQILEKVINPDHQMKKSGWADLPMEILRMIMEKLFWSERLPSCLVCTTWHECFLKIQNEEQFLPWVMTYGGGICKLGNPSAQASRIVEGATHDLLGGVGTVYACDSRYGWVLFSKELDDDYEQELDDDYKQYILYSPFTNEAIKFPELIIGHSRQATFSHNPGCMIIAFSIQCRNLCIETCHPGDKSWKIFEFGGGYKYDFIVALACAVDFVYCVFADREKGLGCYLGADDLYIKLGAFNIKQQDWKVFPGFLPKKNCCFRSLTVAFNGDILLQTVCSDRRQLQFWKFDLSKEKWVVVEDEIMKKHVIFTGCGTSFTVPAVRDARQSAGMVYSFNNCSYFLDSSCFPFDVDPQDDDEIHHRWLNGDYKWLNEDYKELEKIWIQPPFQRISR